MTSPGSNSICQFTSKDISCVSISYCSIINLNSRQLHSQVQNLMLSYICELSILLKVLELYNFCLSSTLILLCSCFTSTHICLAELSLLINWTSSFTNLRVSGVLFHFYSISNRNSCKQTVDTLLRRCVLWHLIWVCSVCQGPQKGMLGLYGLRNSYKVEEALTRLI